MTPSTLNTLRRLRPVSGSERRCSATRAAARIEGDAADLADDPGARHRSGFLLHKHPEHVHEREFPSGAPWSSTPEASEDARTLALLLDVDPVGLVRGRGGSDGAEDQHVNDRPYVASSLMSVVLARWLDRRSAGQRKSGRPAPPPLPLESRSPPSRAAAATRFLRRSLRALGYEVDAVQHPLDEALPSLGASQLFSP
jgi:hypothetical protein